MNSIVIYFSRSGNNYVSGSIVDLPVGNTKITTISDDEAFEVAYNAH